MLVFAFSYRKSISADHEKQNFKLAGKMTVGESLLLATKTQMYMDVVMVSKKNVPLLLNLFFRTVERFLKKERTQFHK